MNTHNTLTKIFTFAALTAAGMVLALIASIETQEQGALCCFIKFAAIVAFFPYTLAWEWAYRKGYLPTIISREFMKSLFEDEDEE